MILLNWREENIKTDHTVDQFASVLEEGAIAIFSVVLYLDKLKD